MTVKYLVTAIVEGTSISQGNGPCFVEFDDELGSPDDHRGDEDETNRYYQKIFDAFRDLNSDGTLVPERDSELMLNSTQKRPKLVLRTGDHFIQVTRFKVTGTVRQEKIVDRIGPGFLVFVEKPKGYPGTSLVLTILLDPKFETVFSVSEFSTQGSDTDETELLTEGSTSGEKSPIPSRFVNFSYEYRSALVPEAVGSVPAAAGNHIRDSVSGLNVYSSYCTVPSVTSGGNSSDTSVVRESMISYTGLDESAEVFTYAKKVGSDEPMIHRNQLGLNKTLVITTQSGHAPIIGDPRPASPPEKQAVNTFNSKW